MLRIYLDHRRASDRPTRAALAVAAPIVGDEVQMINIGWRFSQAALKQALNLKRLQVVNDFAAIAWALPQLTPADVVRIGGGESVPRTTLAALGPGSGLGVSALVPAADGWAVMTGEGGHVVDAGAHARGAGRDRAVARPFRRPLLGGDECCRAPGS